MKWHEFPLLLICVIAFTSCEKQKEAVIENQDIPLLTRMIFSDDLYFEYTYNDANLLKEVKTKWSYTIYKYNSENQLTGYDMYEDPGMFSNNWATADSSMHRTEWVTPANTKISGQARYSYNHGNLQKIAVTSSTTGYSSYTTYEYDANGRIGKQVFYNNDIPNAFREFTYDARGNMILETQKEYVSGIPEVSITTAYEFDDKPNPFKAFRRLLRPGEYSNENNIVRKTMTLFFDIPGVDNLQITESTYEYNEDSYPVKKDNSIRFEYR
jgi:hypothetical protein